MVALLTSVIESVERRYDCRTSPLESEFSKSRDMPSGSILLYSYDDIPNTVGNHFSKTKHAKLEFRQNVKYGMKMELEDWCRINAITTLPPEGLISLP